MVDMSIFNLETYKEEEEPANYELEEGGPQQILTSSPVFTHWSKGDNLEEWRGLVTTSLAPLQHVLIIFRRLEGCRAKP